MIKPAVLTAGRTCANPTGSAYYPGFGQSGMPDRASFAYTCVHYADIIDKLTVKLNATRYSMYVMDYGAPVGYRLAIAHPERVQALIGAGRPSVQA